MSDVALLELTDEEYFKLPALNSSTIYALAEHTPAHAWHQCQWLNPNYQEKDDDQFNVGKYSHKMKLGSGPELVEVDAKDWRTNAAKDAKKAAREAGKIALLKHQKKEVEAQVAAAWRQIDQHALKDLIFRNGLPERTITWKIGDVHCKAKLDWISERTPHFFDDKNTKTSVHPEPWIKHAYNMGYDIQKAWYLRALNALDPQGEAGRRGFWFAQEVDEPYAASVTTLNNMALDLADQKIDFAISLWRHCLERDEWPGYPNQAIMCEAPGYHFNMWDKRLQRSDQYLLSSAYRQSLMSYGNG